MIQIVFEHNYDEFPQVIEGPFEWIEMIGGNMFGLKPGEEEATEIAGVNHDGTWDAGPYEDDGSGKRKRRAYTRWTTYAVSLFKDLPLGKKFKLDDESDEQNIKINDGAYCTIIGSYGHSHSYSAGKELGDFAVVIPLK